MGLKTGFNNFRNSLARRIAYTGNNDYLKDSFEHLTLGAFVASTSTSIKLAAVNACVRILSETPSTLPRTVYKTTGKGKIELSKHRVNTLLHQPNSYMTGVDFHQTMLANRQLEGNAVAVMKSTNTFTGFTTELLPVEWADVRGMRITPDGLFYDITCKQFGINNTYPAAELIHSKIFPKYGLVGRSPITNARETMQSGALANEYEREFWEKKGNLKNYIKDPSNMPPPEKFNEWFEKFKKANSINHGTGYLDGGKELVPVTMPTPDQKFVALKTFNVQDICRFFLVPPHMVFDLLKSSYNTLEQQNRAFVQNRLRPDIKSYEEELQLKLFTTDERQNHNIKFVLDGLLRGDAKTTAEVAHYLVSDGIASVDEVRQTYFNLPPLGGDFATPLIPAHLVGKQPTNANQNSNTDGNE